MTSSDLRALESDAAYLAIRTTRSPTGEIRGQILIVPEPSGLVVLGTGAVALLGYTARRRRPVRVLGR